MSDKDKIKFLYFGTHEEEYEIPSRGRPHFVYIIGLIYTDGQRNQMVNVTVTGPEGNETEIPHVRISDDVPLGYFKAQFQIDDKSPPGEYSATTVFMPDTYRISPDKPAIFKLKSS